MTVTHYSLLNQIFYPYKKFDDLSALEPFMFFALSCIENVKIETAQCESEMRNIEPLGTQEKYNSFQSRIPVMKDGMKTEVTERRGGGKGEPGVPPTEGFPMKGLESFRNPEDFEEAGFGRPWVPPKIDNSNFFSKKQDTLFWAAYTVFHGEAGYWVIGNKYKNTEIAEKQKIIDSIRTTGFLKRAYTKISNVRIQEIMSELMLDKKTSWNTFMAICAFYKFRALVIRGKTYMEFSPEVDNSMGTYLQQYPPGTQEKYNSFHSRIPVTEDGVKTGIAERRGGVWKSEGFPMKGLESFRNPPDFEEAGFGRPGVPPTYLFYKNEDGHISVDLTAIGADKEAEIRNSHLKIDCDEAKPLKAASNYKMEELNDMARILGLEMENGVKVKKADLYDKILEKCIR